MRVLLDCQTLSEFLRRNGHGENPIFSADDLLLSYKYDFNKDQLYRLLERLHEHGILIKLTMIDSSQVSYKFAYLTCFEPKKVMNGKQR